LLFGAIGGLARGLLGAYKNSMNLGERRKIIWGRMLLNIITAMIVGGVVGMIVDGDPVTACASGYVGIDVIESVIKLSK
ncbi:unnamed protein product, partial [marine sediment metagenome]